MEEEQEKIKKELEKKLKRKKIIKRAIIGTAAVGATAGLIHTVTKDSREMNKTLGQLKRNEEQLERFRSIEKTWEIEDRMRAEQDQASDKIFKKYDLLFKELEKDDSADVVFKRTKLLNQMLEEKDEAEKRISDKYKKEYGLD